MSSIGIWMPLYVGDYLADTAHLNAEQHGICLMLMMICWRRGGQLPDDDAQLAAIGRVPPDVWARHRAVILPLFTKTDRGWTHDRIVAEMARAQVVTEKRKAGGRVGAERRWGAARPMGDPMGDPLGDPMGEPLGGPLAQAWQTDGQSQSHSQSQSQSQQESEPAPTPQPPPGDVMPIPPHPTPVPERDRYRVPDPAPAGQRVTDADLEAIWTAAPRRSRERSSRADVARALHAALARGAKPGQIAAALSAYAQSDDATRHNGQYAPALHRLIQSDRWQSWTPQDPRQTLAHWTEEHWRRAVQDWREGGPWPESFGPAPGEEGCLVPAGVVG